MQRDEIIRLICRLPAVLVAICAAMLLYMVVMFVRMPGPPDGPAEPAVAAAAWPEVQLPDAGSWTVFVGQGVSDGAGGDAEGQTFRLAGTFFMLPPSPDAEPVRKAVLDDLADGTQVLVEEGEHIGEATVQAILRDRVTLRFGAREETLFLSFTESALAPVTGEESTGVAPRWDEVTLESNRFGRKIATNRWILSRQQLLDYRNELLDDPERLANLFISMTAKREQGQIEGYRLEKQGEEEFYDAIGFRENDVVRRVNSMKMTKQDRAEYFIREFVDDRLNAVVIDVEREGKPLKLIYYIRE